MTQRSLVALPTFCFATLILLYSVYSASAIEYKFDLPPAQHGQVASFHYQLPSPPNIMPDSPFWLAKVMQDRARIVTATSSLSKAQELLFISNERLSAARVLFISGNPEKGMATLTKAEKYLQSAALTESQARSKGEHTGAFLQQLMESANMHSEVIDSLLSYCPEDACPFVVQIADTPKRLVEQIKTTLSSLEDPLVVVKI